MSTQRMLHLGAFMRPSTIHTGAWRYPGALPDANFNFKALVRLAQKLEQGCFDAFFMADHLAVLNMPVEALKHSHTVTSFDPLTLLPALSVCTTHLRAGWNVVTTANPDAALNFGLTEHMDHAERYRRAREFVDVVTGLWDSWADDAFIRDVESGVFFDPDRLHVLAHKGEHLSVRGPLNIARPIQGWPVIVQAGASEDGRRLAAESAEVVFTAPTRLSDGQRFYADVKEGAERAGRNPEHVKILPAAFVVIGDSADEAAEKRARLDSLVHYESGLASLSIALGHDASGFDPDGPLPEIRETNASKSGRERVIAMARSEHLTVRQLAQRLGGYAGLAMVGTPSMIADMMEEWLLADGADGFTVMFSHLPEGLEDFVDKVVPELQRRGLFRRTYPGSTLRDTLGLPRPENRFFP
jgi:FMN-dependent oxidoreductase (nitrilotriacetate monooxygenase family)